MTLKAGAFGLVLSCLAGTALAENVCAGAKDLTALQVAAVQQELMVAALTCDDAGLYNSFVLAYQKDLQASDKALLAYFQRANADDGTADYHRFKTRLANLYSLKSLDSKKGYCRSAELLFASALNDKLSLAAFALAQPATNVPSSTACGDSVAGVAMVAKRPEPAKPAAAAVIVAGGAATQKNAAPTDPPSASGPPAAESIPPRQADAAPPPPPAPPIVRNNVPDPYAPAPNRGDAFAYRDGGRAQMRQPPQVNPRPPLRGYRYDARDRYACANYYGRDPYYRGPYRTNDPCYEIYRWYYDRDYYRWYGAPPQQYWRR